MFVVCPVAVVLMVGTALVRLALVVCPGRLLGELDDSAVLVGLAVLAKRLVVVDDWLVPVVCCEVVGRTVVPELVAMLPVPVVCPVEEAVPLVLGVTRLALEVCTEPVDR